MSSPAANGVIGRPRRRKRKRVVLDISETGARCSVNGVDALDAGVAGDDDDDDYVYHDEDDVVENGKKGRKRSRVCGASTKVGLNLKPSVSVLPASVRTAKRLLSSLGGTPLAAVLGAEEAASALLEAASATTVRVCGSSEDQCALRMQLSVKDGILGSVVEDATDEFRDTLCDTISAIERSQGGWRKLPSASAYERLSCALLLCIDRSVQIALYLLERRRRQLQPRCLDQPKARPPETPRAAAPIPKTIMISPSPLSESLSQSSHQLCFNPLETEDVSCFSHATREILPQQLCFGTPEQKPRSSSSSVLERLHDSPFPGAVSPAIVSDSSRSGGSTESSVTSQRHPTARKHDCRPSFARRLHFTEAAGNEAMPKKQGHQPFCPVSSVSTTFSHSHSDENNDAVLGSWREQAVRETMAVALESLQLQVLARCCTGAKGTWGVGRKKSFDAYLLPSPASLDGPSSDALWAQELRRRVKREFRRITSPSHSRRHSTLTETDVSDDNTCRVYASVRRLYRGCTKKLNTVQGKQAPSQSSISRNCGDIGPSTGYPGHIEDVDVATDDDDSEPYVFLQIFLGQSPYFAVDDDSIAAAMQHRRLIRTSDTFVCVMKPGERVLVLNGGSGNRSTSQINTGVESDVLAAIEASVCKCPTDRLTTQCQDSRLDASDEDSSASFRAVRIKGSSGNNPIQLLTSTLASGGLEESVKAAARFSQLSKSDCDGSELYDNSGDRNPPIPRMFERRLEHGKSGDDDRDLVAFATNVQKFSRGEASLVAATERGFFVDESYATHQSRERAAASDMGDVGDCRQVQRVVWNWCGLTSASSTCWESEAPTQAPSLCTERRTRFECGVVMEGTNVYAGLRALAAAGLVKGQLPAFVRDAPLMRSSIIAVHGDEYGPVDDQCDLT